ncbi:MAG: hypothetical protein QM758_07640 [Armatimonas sp.]
MRNIGAAIALLTLGCCLAACNNEPSTTPDPNASPAARSGGAPGAATAGGYMSQPKSSFTYQLKLLKEGDTEKLKGCFTDRVRDNITQEMVDKAKGKAGEAPVEELYASEEPGEADGNKTVKVKMKNGRTLTTLIQTNGRWLSDTIWFK